ncbi:MAG: hypothetical protein MUE41_02245 [Gemmatimonadaceae bacterium]|nr:hypothetical protein [Gemmatimonadaceae bacterium]
MLRDAPLRTTEEGGAPHSSTSVIPSEGRSPESRDLRAHTALSIAYYANSYVAAIDPSDPCVLATSTHERDRFAAVVQVARTIGVQFHPEKSSADGVAFLRGIVAAAFGVAVAA